MNMPDWFGLLKWSIGYSDGTAPSNFTPMSEEDKKWLEAVMQETVKDEPKRMKEIMVAFLDMMEKQSSVGREDECLDMLEELKDIVGQIDMANIFSKYGGSACMLKIVESGVFNVDIQCAALSVLATISQNNIQAQQKFFDENLMDKLMQVLNTKSSSLKLHAKGVYALSCMIRGHAAAEEYFSINFLEPLAQAALDSNHPQFLVRVVFLCNALVSSDSASKSRIQRIVNALIPRVCNSLVSEDADLRDLSERFVKTVLHTEYGWTLISRSYKTAFTQQLQAARAVVSNQVDVSGEDVERELRALAAVEEALQTLSVEYPPVTASPASRQGSAPTPSTHRNTPLQQEEDDNTDDSRKRPGSSGTLMIAPPPPPDSSDTS